MPGRGAHRAPAMEGRDRDVVGLGDRGRLADGSRPVEGEGGAQDVDTIFAQEVLESRVVAEVAPVADGHGRAPSRRRRGRSRSGRRTARPSREDESPPSAWRSTGPRPATAGRRNRARSRTLRPRRRAGRPAWPGRRYRTRAPAPSRRAWSTEWRRRDGPRASRPGRSPGAPRPARRSDHGHGADPVPGRAAEDLVDGRLRRLAEDVETGHVRRGAGRERSSRTPQVLVDADRAGRVHSHERQ